MSFCPSIRPRCAPPSTPRGLRLSHRAWACRFDPRALARCPCPRGQCSCPPDTRSRCRWLDWPSAALAQAGSGSTSRLAASATYAAVSRARARSLDQSADGAQRGEVRRRGGRLGAAGVVEGDVGVTLGPLLGVPRGLAVPEQDDPCGSPLVADHVGGQRDRRAVAPQPLQGVELPLLLVLDVHHDLAVVDEHPPAVAFALAAQRLGADLAQLVLDLVDDRLDLAVVGAAGDQEGVGDGELVADVEGDDLAGELVGAAARRR